MTPEVRLCINGRKYGGWKTVRVGRSIEQVAGIFQLTVTEKWPDQPLQRKIKPGDACTLEVDGAVVITGFVDTVEPRYDAEKHDIRVIGRDKTGDLVDCSAQYQQGQIKGRNLAQIADALAGPFGIEIITDTDIGASFKSFSLQEGETIFESLDRAAKHRGVLIVTPGDGTLKIVRASTEVLPVSLELGKNILSARATFSHRDRFNRYVVKGSTAGDDFLFGEAAAHNIAEVTDTEIRAPRVSVTVAEDNADLATCNKRAQWQRNTAIARSVRVVYLVQGWTYDAKNLWRPNVNVHVRDAFLGIDMNLLIVAVAFVLDADGTRTELTLARREAYDLIPIPEPTREELWTIPDFGAG